MPISVAWGVSNVTPASPIALTPWLLPVKFSRSIPPNPVAPGGGTVPSVMHTTRTLPGTDELNVGQSTARPLLPRNIACTCALNAVEPDGGIRLKTAGSNVVITSKAPRFVTPCTATSIVACAP